MKTSRFILTCALLYTIEGIWSLPISPMIFIDYVNYECWVCRQIEILRKFA